MRLSLIFIFLFARSKGMVLNGPDDLDLKIFRLIRFSANSVFRRRDYSARINWSSLIWSFFTSEAVLIGPKASTDIRLKWFRTQNRPTRWPLFTASPIRAFLKSFKGNSDHMSDTEEPVSLRSMIEVVSKQRNPGKEEICQLTWGR